MWGLTITAYHKINAPNWSSLLLTFPGVFLQLTQKIWAIKQNHVGACVRNQFTQHENLFVWTVRLAAGKQGLREGDTRVTSEPGAGCTGAREDESTHATSFSNQIQNC